MFCFFLKGGRAINYCAMNLFANRVLKYLNLCYYLTNLCSTATGLSLLKFTFRVKIIEII